MLVGWKQNKPLPEGCDPFKASATVEELFGSLSGAQLLDSIVEFYGDGVVDFEWYGKNSDGEACRALVRSPLSRNIQEGTVQAYMRKILEDGLSQAVSGKVFHAYFLQFCTVLSLIP